MRTMRSVRLPNMLSWPLLWMLLAARGAARANIADSGSSKELKCEPIKLELCNQYNSTGMPNFMGHQLQGDAKAGLETFLPLIQYGCSSELLFFLCSVHVPMCVNLPPSRQSTEPAHALIGPCRPLCQRVKNSCLRILQNFNLEWPESLSCDKFPPTNNHSHMCMDGGPSRSKSSQNKKAGGGASYSTFQSLQNYPELISKYKDISKDNPEHAKFDPIIRLIENSVHNIKPAKADSGKCSSVAFPGHHHYVNRTGQCVPKCGVDILFKKEDKEFVLVWMGVWASLCFVGSSFAILTFLLDTGVLVYPERCLVFLNLSYLLMSAGYLVRLLAGPGGVSCMRVPGGEGTSLLVREGLTSPPQCTTVFLLLYFSSLSSAVWWAITTTIWALLLLCSLDQTQLASRAPLYHSLGWGVPAVFTLTALVRYQIDGEELTGLCAVGQQSEDTLLYMLVIPASVLLGSAFIFYLSGLVASLVTPSQEARSLMAKISIFFVLYGLPQTCVVGSLVYEMIERKHWRQDPAANRPNIEVFILRIFMWLIVGIIASSWVFTRKTVQSWSSCFSFCFSFWNRRKKPPTPVFPKVAYHPANIDTSSDVVTLGDLATLKSGYRPEMEPLDKRIVLGSAGGSRIVL